MKRIEQLRSDQAALNNGIAAQQAQFNATRGQLAGLAQDRVVIALDPRE